MTTSRAPVLGSRLARVASSPTIRMAARVIELRRQGVDIANFAAGEPDLDTPRHVIEAAKRALDEGQTRYTEPAGTLELRTAVARWLQDGQGVTLSPDEVIVSAGAKLILYQLFQVLLDPGDEVIIPTPCWVSYGELVKLAGGEPVFVPTRAEDGFCPQPDRIAQAITRRTKAMVIATPANPTGAVMSEELVDALVSMCAASGIVAISDDIYRALSFERPAASVCRAAQRLGAPFALVDGLSKVYCMTGWRIGFGGGHPELVRALVKLQTQTIACATSVAQAAALAALTGPQDFVTEMHAEFARRRRLTIELARALPAVRLDVPPAGTFYAFPDFRAWVGACTPDGARLADDVALAEYLLDAAHVAVNPGSAFLAPGFLRISFACSTQTIERGFARIGEALERLRPSQPHQAGAAPGSS